MKKKTSKKVIRLVWSVDLDVYCSMPFAKAPINMATVLHVTATILRGGPFSIRNGGCWRMERSSQEQSFSPRHPGCFSSGAETERTCHYQIEPGWGGKSWANCKWVEWIGLLNNNSNKKCFCETHICQLDRLLQLRANKISNYDCQVEVV